MGTHISDYWTWTYIWKSADGNKVDIMDIGKLDCPTNIDISIVPLLRNLELLRPTSSLPPIGITIMSEGRQIICEL